MRANEKVPGPSLLARLSSLLHAVSCSFHLALNRVFSLLVIEHWTRHTLKRIVNHQDEAKRSEMVKTYIENEIAKMNTTSAALIAGVISSTFDWYNVANTNWVTKSAWYSGLVLAIASVASSAIHTAAFLRIKCSAKVTERFQNALGRNKKGQGEWEPHHLMPYVLGGPTLHLKLAVLMFLIGLFYELWRAAVEASLSWQSDDLKIAFIVTLAGGFVVVNYIFAVATLVHHSTRTKVKIEPEGLCPCDRTGCKNFNILNHVRQIEPSNGQLGFYSFRKPAFASGESQLSDILYGSSGKGIVAVDMDCGPDLDERHRSAGLNQSAQISTS
ncbi:MAG: hypothetical protein Q9208_006089 [Pyrenodesmia sp. 3 TL-2023]